MKFKIFIQAEYIMAGLFAVLTFRSITAGHSQSIWLFGYLLRRFLFECKNKFPPTQSLLAVWPNVTINKLEGAPHPWPNTAAQEKQF